MARIRRRSADGWPQAPAPQDAGAETSAPPPETAADPASEAAHTDAPGQATAPLPPVDAATADPAATTVIPAGEETAVVPAGPETAVIPAGADPSEARRGQPGFRERATMRRRLRYLRRLRELGFRDVGGLVFDLDRFGRDRPDLVRAKLDALNAVDHELRALEEALDDRRPFHDLHEPGVAACPRCGVLHGSEARFCPSCGLPLQGPLAIGEVAAPLPAPPHPGSASAEEQAAPPAAAPEHAVGQLAASQNGSTPPEQASADEIEQTPDPARDTTS